MVFAPDGSGRQAGPDGTWYDYPLGTFTTATLQGREIPCVSSRRQRWAHTGYQLRPEDDHDLDELNRG